MSRRIRQFPQSKLRSAEKVRSLDAASLFTNDSTESSAQSEFQTEWLPCEIGDDDTLLLEVQELIDDYAGVIFTGSPGTSKSWYAAQIAAKLADRDPERVRFVQFHASYQYEDFVEGYVPKKDGEGFILIDKHLLDMCDIARRHQGELCIIVVDELSRSDPGRVFGEALTYIEVTKRDQKFHLASGNTASIPPNLWFIATMNPMDRGVDEVDAALERRFAKIAMDPSAGMLESLLAKNGMDEALRRRVIQFFRFLQGNSNDRCKVGHAYFRAAVDEDDLKRLWERQLRFHMAKAFPLNSDGYRSIEEEWEKIFPKPAVAAGDRSATTEAEGGEEAGS
jgi:5-methylcytosine-specific restriction protein B